ncbi:MAG: hypothetical protein A2008_04570 [Candidatus Wallbacteria bacterium GWC2_49_35]|uniref:Attractin/MKLN-like beta-propeller domain-containing protein n=1 Tax=Candidatus Wallbacteria bacterium GWC2_49_35 TaxID=1817813 RepID=A0A1F7WVN6_9BACT|nr:MAG: hypothetical protein A2008_04570 [Candidatus Wallbacteria bacterium GWC2_49_35]
MKNKYNISLISMGSPAPLSMAAFLFFLCFVLNICGFAAPASAQYSIPASPEPAGQARPETSAAPAEKEKPPAPKKEKPPKPTKPPKAPKRVHIAGLSLTPKKGAFTPFEISYYLNFKFKKNFGAFGASANYAASVKALGEIFVPARGEALLYYAGTVETAVIGEDGFFAFSIPESSSGGEMALKLRRIAGGASVTSESAEVRFEKGKNYIIKLYPRGDAKLKLLTSVTSAKLNVTTPDSLKRGVMEQIAKIARSSKKIGGIAGKIKNLEYIQGAKTVKLTLLPDKKETKTDKNGNFKFGGGSVEGARLIMAKAGDKVKLEKTAEIKILRSDYGYIYDAVSIKFNSPPEISKVAAAGNTNDITINYEIYDEDGDECAVSSFYYSTDNGVSFKTSENIIESGRPPGFLDRASGGRRSLLWRSRSDIANNPNNVIVKLTASDKKEESRPALSPSFSIRNNNRPVLSNVVVSGSSDEITINYDLADPDNNTSSVSVHYSIDNGMSYVRTDSVSGDINFVTPTAAKKIIWRSRENIKTDNHNVKIKLAAFDGVEESQHLIPSAISVFNNFTRPEIKINSIAGDSNEIEVMYNLSDSDENMCLVEMCYSTDSKKFFRSTAVSGDINSVKPRNDLKVRWSSRSDLKVDTESLYLELTAFDGTGYGNKSVYGPVKLFNNRPPNVENIYPADVSGEVVIFYDLIDEESDTCGVDFYYSLDNGLNFNKNANITGEMSSVRPGVRRSIKWKTRPELSGDYDGIKVKIAAWQYPEKYGRPGISTPFSVRNNRAPGVSNLTCAGGSDEIEVSFDLNDADNHSCTIEVFYSLDNGASFIKTANLTSDETQLKPGRAKTIKWLSKKDFITSEEKVLLRITPFDKYIKGYDGVSAPFTVSNNEAPAVSNIVTSGDSGEISVYYDIYDAEKNTCEVKLWYLVDGAKEYIKSVHISGDHKSVAPGAGRRIIWDSRSDFTGDYGGVKIKLVADDSNLRGAEGFSGAFAVRNNRLPEISGVSVTSSSGDITINYNLSDADGDDCAIELYYSTDNGAVFKKSKSVSGDLKSMRPDGRSKSIMWSSGEDIAGEFSRSFIKLAARDKSGIGPETVFGPFTIDNKNICAVSNLKVTPGPNGIYYINYSLGAYNDNLCTVEVYYSLDGENFPAGNKLKGILGDAVGIGPGKNKKMIWDPSGDMMIDSKIYLKLSPIDIKARGAAGYSKPFAIKNGPVEVKLMPEVWPREGHAHMCLNKKMFIIGGWAGSPNYYNDVTIIDYDPSSGSSAVEISQNHYSSVRYSLSSAVYDEKLWLMGGFFNKSKNDVWYSSDGTTWVEITKNETESVKFSMRDSHTSAVFDDGFGEKLFVIGGFSSGYKNDVWCSVTGSQWTCITAEASFSPRVGHSSAVFGGKIYVMGGFDGEKYKSDVWRSPDGIRWEPAAIDAGFAPRRGHACVVYRQKLWIIGGYGENEKYYNDIWCSSDGSNWFEIRTSAPGSPVFTPRQGHSAVVYKDNLWIFGGYDGTSYRGDFWKVR